VKDGLETPRNTHWRTLREIPCPSAFIGGSPGSFGAPANLRSAGSGDLRRAAPNDRTGRISRPRAGVQQLSKFARPTLENRANREFRDRYPRFREAVQQFPRCKAGHCQNRQGRMCCKSRRPVPLGMGWRADEAPFVAKVYAKTHSRCAIQGHNSGENAGKHGLSGELCNSERGPRRQVPCVAKLAGKDGCSCLLAECYREASLARRSELNLDASSS
jgi:hypothetical protein